MPHTQGPRQAQRLFAPVKRNNQIVRDPKDDITLADVRRCNCCVNDVPRPADWERSDLRLIDSSLGKPCRKLRVVAG